MSAIQGFLIHLPLDANLYLRDDVREIYHVVAEGASVAWCGRRFIGPQTDDGLEFNVGDLEVQGDPVLCLECEQLTRQLLETGEVLPADYHSLEDFYADEDFRTETGVYRQPARGRSPECDYGVWWSYDGKFPYYRVSYVKNTGEVYLVNLSSRWVAIVTDVKPDESDVYYRTLDKMLEGWADGPMTLRWLFERLKAVVA